VEATDESYAAIFPAEQIAAIQDLLASKDGKGCQLSLSRIQCLRLRREINWSDGESPL